MAPINIENSTISIETTDSNFYPYYISLILLENRALNNFIANRRSHFRPISEPARSERHYTRFFILPITHLIDYIRNFVVVLKMPEVATAPKNSNQVTSAPEAPLAPDVTSKITMLDSHHVVGLGMRRSVLRSDQNEREI